MTFLYSKKDAGQGTALFYTGDLDKACLKFEINVSEDWNYGAMQFCFAPYDAGTSNSYFDDGNHPSPCWEPWRATGSYRTDGWQTVSIPLSEFKYKADAGTCSVKLTNSMLGGFYCFIFKGSLSLTDVPEASCEIEIKMDNFRIVPL
jgi:hypothetical protein